MRRALTLATGFIGVCFLSLAGEPTVASVGVVASPIATPALNAPCPDGIVELDHSTMPGACGELCRRV